ncbi:MAG: hypothetical protein ABIR67_08085, partial [Gaiellaceae bacterium]
DQVGELRAALALPERGDLELCEHRSVELDARRWIANAELDVVEDDAADPDPSLNRSYSVSHP